MTLYMPCFKAFNEPTNGSCFGPALVYDYGHTQEDAEMRTYTVTFTTHTWTGRAIDAEEAQDRAIIDAEDSGIVHGDVISIRRV